MLCSLVHKCNLLRVIYIVMDPALLLPVRDCTANHRHVLSSERAPYMKKKLSLKEIKIWSYVRKGARNQEELAD
jgi:hypothetical protein